MATHLALLGILFHSILTALHAPAAFAGAVGSRVDPESGLLTVVICTSEGFKRVVLGADGQPVEQHQPGNQLQFCQHCIAGCGGCFAISSAGQTLLATAYQHAIELKRVLGLIDERTATSDHNRDPPHSV